MRGTWKRGHAARGAGGYTQTARAGLELLPGPDDDGLGVGEAPDVTGWQPVSVDDLPEADSTPGTAPEDSGEAEPDLDPAPAPIGKRQTAGKRPAARVTGAMRKDIEAKLGIMLELPGRVWEARDPICGGTFVAQIPAIRPALLDLICQSPDLVAWFTGVGGGFMLWLNIIMACQPVAMTIWAHHITHAIGDGQDQERRPVDAAAFAA